MPNGRSGGFLIKKADLQSLVRTFTGGLLIAERSEGSPRLRPADAAEIAQVVNVCPHDRIAVEEQDHSAYVIHLGDQPEILWLLVGPEAPLFSELCQWHQRWSTEHPDWKGWIAF